MNKAGQRVEAPNDTQMSLRYAVVYGTDGELVHTFVRVDVGDSDADEDALLSQAVDDARGMREEAGTDLRASLVDALEFERLVRQATSRPGNAD